MSLQSKKNRKKNRAKTKPDKGWTWRNKFESAFQAFLISLQDLSVCKEKNEPYVLDGTVIGSTNSLNEIDKNKIHFLINPITFTSKQILDIRTNTRNFLFGNLSRVTSECLRDYLDKNGYPRPVSGKGQIFIKNLPTDNLRFVYVIIACLGNAYAHNSFEGKWNITWPGYELIWTFDSKKSNFLNRINFQVNMCIGLMNKHNTVIDFDKDFGGFGNIFSIYEICRRLFHREIYLLDI